MYSTTLKQNCQNISPIKLSVTKTHTELQFKDELLSQTTFLNIYTKTPLKLRYFCVLNDVHENPTCKCCDKPVVYKKDYPDKGFGEYCSPTCSRSDKTVPKDALKKLENKDWLYHQRITLKKSKELIAEELGGLSITPINKWLKYHDIPDVRYNESNSLSKIKLMDKDWLYNEHITNHRKCEDIGNELGVSKSTVSIHLAKHNIIANEGNSYDRINSGPSGECQEIINFIKGFYTKEILIDKRNIIGSLELDIYLPEDNLAIEYNGVYSHIFRPEETNFSKRKDSDYHITKTNRCDDKNIQLIHIISSQWKSNPEIWKSFIKNKLGYTENKVFARKCIVKEVSVYDKNLFLDGNHIQGNCQSNIRYGLYDNGELVSLMTFTKSRYNKNYDWELIRFCNKLDYNVVGGFTKLLTHFKRNHSGTIISYANRNYSKGLLYENNGFTLLKINPPSYWYVDLNNEFLIHKSNLTKGKLLEKLYQPTWTEEMLATELGYKKIFDCGTITYIMDN